MKKFLFFAAIVACSLMIISCEKKDKTEEAKKELIAQVKADAQGKWEGYTGFRELVILTIEGDKITAEFEQGNPETVNITKWDCDGTDVWVTLDDDMSSALKVKVEGDKMYLVGNSTYTLNVFPSELTRVK